MQHVRWFKTFRGASCFARVIVVGDVPFLRGDLVVWVKLLGDNWVVDKKTLVLFKNSVRVDYAFKSGHKIEI